MFTRTEYTIEVSRTADFQKSSSYTLIPVAGGSLEVTQQRLDDLEGLDGDQFFRLVKREITTTEWEPA
jgi:hypothetical protein